MSAITGSGGNIHFPDEVQPSRAGGSNKQPQTTTSANKGSRSTLPTHTRHTNSARRQMLVEHGADPLSTPGPAPHAVVGVSNQGIAVIDGALHVWNAKAGQWNPASTKGIAGLKLGANNDQVWALNHQGDLHQVDSEGAVVPAGAFRLPAGVVDFAVSPSAAAVTFITAHGALQRQHGHGPAQSLPLPPELAGTPATLAQTNQGDLYLASHTGDVWRLAPPAAGAPAPGAAALAWSRIGTADGAGAPRQFSKLQVLADGSLGAKDARGDLYKYDRYANQWSGTSPTDGSDHRKAFNAMPAGSAWNHIRLNRAPVNYFRLGMTASTSEVAGHGDYAAMKTTVGRAMTQLSRAGLDGTPTVATLAPAQRDAVAARLVAVDVAAMAAIERLEEGMADLPHADARKVNGRDHNALRAVYDFRSQILGRKRHGETIDPVMTGLAGLLRDGVCLPADEQRGMFPAGQLLVDHALLKQDIDAGKAAAPPRPGAPAPAVTVSAEEAAAVTTVFAAGLVDGKHFERSNAVSTSFNASLAEISGAMKRTVTQGIGADADGDAGAIGAKYADLVCNLRPGKESIVLNFSHSKGVDLEGMWMFFNLNSDTFGKTGANVLSANKLPILTPLGTASMGATLSLETSRTATGVQVTLSDGNAASLSVGARAQLRVGLLKPRPKDALLLAVTGVEAALIPGGGMTNMRSIAMHFTQDDAGKVQDVIAGLYRGEVPLTDLMKRADLVTNAKGDSFNVNAEGYVHGFIALRGNYGEQSGKLPKNVSLQASNLVVPALDQLSGKINYDSKNTSSRDNQGNASHSHSAGTTGTVDASHITVLDISTWFSLPFGKDASTQLQFKVPFLLSVLNRKLWANKLAPKDTTVHLGADGALAGASVSVATQEAAVRSATADRPLTNENFPQLDALLAELPDLGRLVDHVNRSPAQRPTVTLELTPAALATVHEGIAALARAGLQGPARAQAVTDLINRELNEPASVRIARIDVATVKAKGDMSIQAFGFLRATRAQDHTFNEAGSSIAVHYDPDTGAATGFTPEGKAVLGDNVVPQLSRLRGLA